MNETNTSVDVDVKADLLKKIREKVTRIDADFQSRTPDTEGLLQQAQEDQDKVLGMINDQLRSVEAEKIKISEEIEGFRKEAEEARAEKMEAEEAAEKALAEKDEAVKAAETAQTEKEEAVKAAETAQAERSEAVRAAETATAERSEAVGQAEKALAERAGLEKKIEETSRELKTLNDQITVLKSDLEKSVNITETAVRERTQLQEKLDKFQEHWEKHVEGR